MNNIPLGNFLSEYTERNTNNAHKPVAVGRYGIRTRESIYSKELAKDYSKNKLIFKDTLTVGMGSVQIDIGVLSTDNVYSVSPAYHTYRINGINPDYLRYCLECRNQDMFVRYVKKGSRQGKTIDLSRWLTYEIPVYSQDKQKEIVTRIDSVQKLVEANELQLAKLDELVKSRFVEMFGDPVSNPKGWPVQNFEDISVLITDGEHATPRRSERGIYLLSARNVLNHTLQLDDVDFIDEEEYCRIARRVAPQEGDVLISCSGSIGRCCVVPANLRFQMVRSTALIRFTEEINPIFAEWLIASEELQRQIAQSATQSSQANLFQGKIQKLHGYVPPKELQDEFAAFAAEVDKSKLAVKQSLEKLETLKKSLMQQYFG